MKKMMTGIDKCRYLWLALRYIEVSARISTEFQSNPPSAGFLLPEK